MSGTTGTVPLQTVVADQLITPALWNGELANIGALMDAAGCGGHSGTDAETQIQTAPFPGSVLSKATSQAGEDERIRYQIAQILGTDYWYKPAPTDLTTVASVIVPVGGVIDYPVATAPSSKWHLADGTAISRAGYPTLFALVGTTFGVGDGATTFNLPDYRDRMSIGAGTSYAVAATGGATTQTPVDSGHTHASAAHAHTMANHTHSTPNHAHAIDYTVSLGATTGVGAVASGDTDGLAMNAVSGGSATLRRHTNQTKNSGGSTSGTPSSNSTDSATPAATGSGISNIGAISTLPPYLGMYKMMRVL